jgi:hypothetical protein
MAEGLGGGAMATNPSRLGLKIYKGDGGCAIVENFCRSDLCSSPSSSILYPLTANCLSSSICNRKKTRKLSLSLSLSLSPQKLEKTYKTHFLPSSEHKLASIQTPIHKISASSSFLFSSSSA